MRSSEKKGLTIEDALHETFDDLDIPLIYNANIGHVPPQVILVNGAWASITSSHVGAFVEMSFK